MPSVVIARYEYDEATQVLRVTFVSGAIYEYLNVPASTYMEMKQAFSKGTYLNKFVKTGFHFRKLA